MVWTIRNTTAKKFSFRMYSVFKCSEFESPLYLLVELNFLAFSHLFIYSYLVILLYLGSPFTWNKVFKVLRLLPNHIKNQNQGEERLSYLLQKGRKRLPDPQKGNDTPIHWSKNTTHIVSCF